MPRKRTRRRRTVPSYLNGFPERLNLLKDASGLSWAELARRIGTNTLAVRRWRAGTHPNSQHLLALMVLAGKMGLGHLLTTNCSPDDLKAISSRPSNQVGQHPKTPLLSGSIRDETGYTKR